MLHPLDALSASPAHHKLLLENAQVRVLETIIKPGETTALHTHQWPAVHTVLGWSDFVRRDDHGTITLDTRELPVRGRAGQATWSGPLGPHTLENVGPVPLHVISVEVKAGP